MICISNQNGLTVSKAGLNSHLVKQSASEFRQRQAEKTKVIVSLWKWLSYAAYFPYTQLIEF